MPTVRPEHPGLLHGLRSKLVRLFPYVVEVVSTVGDIFFVEFLDVRVRMRNIVCRDTGGILQDSLERRRKEDVCRGTYRRCDSVHAA